MQEYFKKCCGKKGQVIIEYIITTAVLMATIAIIAVFLYTFRENSGRIINLSASEFP